MLHFRSYLVDLVMLNFLLLLVSHHQTFDVNRINVRIGLFEGFIYLKILCVLAIGVFTEVLVETVPDVLVDILDQEVTF